MTPARAAGLGDGGGRAVSAYYNEHDPFAAAWLRELIKAGEIAPGDVDERSIEDVRPDELVRYAQCHFFAGIGVWSYALRQAGWPDGRAIWTGSCPCQPFSAAGQGVGFADERHLWPAFFHLISQRRPDVVLGEQVASKDGLAWLDLVQADMEGAGYAIGATDTCAAGYGAPQIRQRLYFVGLAGAESRAADWFTGSGSERSGQEVVDGSAGRGGLSVGMAGSIGERRERRQGATQRRLDDGPDAGWLEGHDGPVSGGEAGAGTRPASPTNGVWRDADWLYCRDGKWRPVEPGSFPLAHGAPARVGRLRGYGNAVVAEQAIAWAEEVMAVMAS